MKQHIAKILKAKLFLLIILYLILSFEMEKINFLFIFLKEIEDYWINKRDNFTFNN